jgi:uncharacterized protein (TIGR00369 family)
VVGTELNATHHRAVSSGKVRGECRPLHLGRQSQSWEIVVFDERGGAAAPAVWARRSWAEEGCSRAR